MIIKCAVMEYTDELMKGVRTIWPEEQINRLPDTMIRVSEIVEVEFPDRNKDEIIPELLNAVDEEIKEEEKKHNIKIAQLKTKRAELLCIDFKG
jgi:hypothetical protein